MGVHYIAGLRMVSFSFHIVLKLLHISYRDIPDLLTIQVVCVNYNEAIEGNMNLDIKYRI